MEGYDKKRSSTFEEKESAPRRENPGYAYEMQGRFKGGQGAAAPSKNSAPPCGPNEVYDKA